MLERAQICPLNLDQDAVDSFLAYGAVIGPNTIYREIRELEPGHLLRVSRSRGSREYGVLVAQPQPRQLRNPAEIRDFDHAVSLIRERLEYAVESHLVSDVPMGVFLSGGMDSSLLALLAARFAKSPITLLTVAFPEQEFSELPYARQNAKIAPWPSRIITK